MKIWSRLFLAGTLVFVMFSISNAQLRTPDNKTTPKQAAVKSYGKPIDVFMQFEPALSFPKGHSTTILGLNFSMLHDVFNTPLKPDSSIELLTRLRFTSGFWHFSGKGHDFGWIPIEAGADLGFPFKMQNGSLPISKIIPFMGYQFGMGFTLYDDRSGIAELVDNIRLGADFELENKLDIGLSFIINGLIFDDVRYNQLGFSIKFPLQLSL